MGAQAGSSLTCKEKVVCGHLDGQKNLSAVVIKFEGWIPCDANVQNCETPSMQRGCPVVGNLAGWSEGETARAPSCVCVEARFQILVKMCCNSVLRGSPRFLTMV